MALPSHTGAVIDCAGRVLDLRKPRVMGVLNVTPDSFSDGGQLYTAGRVCIDTVRACALRMVEDGAVVLDIGGESTRPGADPVSEAEELDRVVPVIEALSREVDAVLSVDTSTPSVMAEAARAGAGMINDVRALQRPGALDAALESGLPVCLMHMKGQPETMQKAPTYADVVAEVASFLKQRTQVCTKAGIGADRILLDPGFGFGKLAAHNYQLLNRLDELLELGFPLIAGLSRKSMIAAVIDRAVDERLSASIALAVLATARGARLLRVHDVKQSADALAMVAAMETMTE